MLKKYLGIVSYDLHPNATYVRVHIPTYLEGVSPLSIKATRSDFPRGMFKQGTVVWVQESDPKDARRFKIIEVLEPKKDDVPDGFAAAVAEGISKYMRRAYQANVCENVTQALGYPVSRQVRFFIGRRYFNDEPWRDRLRTVLEIALGVTYPEAVDITSGHGSWIICREDQFARFLIERDGAGIPNGFQDLRVEYVDDQRDQVAVNVSGRFN